MSPCDDATLSRREFVELYEATESEIYRYAARRMGREIAEDITATTFSEAWSSRRRYDPSLARPRTWIWSIAVRVTAKYARSEDRKLRALARVPPERSGDETDRADDRLDAQRDLAVIVERVRGLSQPDRDVLFLVAWAELSYRDVAEVLGIPVGTVKSRLNHARRRLGSRGGPRS